MKKKQKKQKINFCIGDEYVVHKGPFIIKGVDRKSDVLNYVWAGEDEIKETSLKGMEGTLLCKMWKGPNIGNIYKREGLAEALEHSNEKFYFTIGFLAKNCKIIARVTPKTEHRFANDYMSIKGTYPYDLDGYEVDTCTNTWGSVIRIVFDTKNISSLAFFSFPNEPINGSGDYELIINNLEWGMELLEMGFNVGKNHNIEEIKSNVPAQYIKNFEEGLSYE
jgi:hypothetical protein